MSRILAVARLEWRLQMTSAPVWVLLVLVFATTSTINPLAMIPGGAETIGGTRAFANSVYALAPSFAIGTFFAYPFLVALIAGLGIIRDDDVRIAELIRSTPLTAREETLGRLLGIAATLSVAVVVHLVVMLVFRESGAGRIERGPWSLWAYAVPIAVFVIPTVWWCAGLAFALGGLTRRPTAVYAFPVVLSVLMFGLLWNWRPVDIDPTVDTLLVLIDPTALRWLTHHLFADDRGFAHYNHAALAIDLLLVANRVVTIALPALAVVLMSHRRGAATREAATPNRNTRAPSARRSDSGRVIPHGSRPTFGGLRGLAMENRPPSARAAAFTVMRAELREVSRQPSLYLFAVLLFALVPEVAVADADPYTGSTAWSAGDLAVRALPVVTTLIALYLLALVTESMQRDRVTGFDAIAHSTPIRTGALLSGRAFAAFGVATALTLGCAGVTAMMAVRQGDAPLQLAPIAMVFGAVLLPTFVLWIAFVMLVSAATAQRASALAFGVAALLLTAALQISGGMTWVTNWPLWGALRWTDFGTFPIHGPALLANRLLAVGLAACAFAGTALVYTRRVPDRAASKARRNPELLWRRALAGVPLAVLPVLTAGFLAIRIESPRDASTVASEVAPPVTIRAMDVTLTLDPAQQQLHVDGEYTVAHSGASTVLSLPITLPAGTPESSWSHDGRALIVAKERLQLPHPLSSGDSVRLHFRYTARIPAGASRNGGDVANYIHTSGALLSTHRGEVLPRFGRSAVGWFNGGRPFGLRLTVDVPVAFVVSAVGELVTETLTDSRRRSIWASPVPLFAVTVAAAPYRIIRDAGVAVYHLPEHVESAQQIGTTLAAARRHYSAWFGALPWKELRVNEHAALFTQATAYPAAIAMSETMGFKTTRGTRGDLAFAVTAHEAAHQWWGHLLNVGDAPGSGILLEGMADYAALRLHAAVLGDSARAAFARHLELEYLAGRRMRDEPSLAEALEGTAWHEAVLQKKGAWVLWMLQEEVGTERMDRALRAVLAAHPVDGPPATLGALVSAVRAVAADTAAYDRFIRQWIGSRGLPSFTVVTSACKSVIDRWDCEATVRNTGDAAATVEIAALHDDVQLPVRVRVELAAGSTRRINFSSHARPTAIEFDPDARVLQEGRARWGLPP
jgi:hypothetical protein